MAPLTRQPLAHVPAAPPGRSAWSPCHATVNGSLQLRRCGTRRSCMIRAIRTAASTISSCSHTLMGSHPCSSSSCSESWSRARGCARAPGTRCSVLPSPARGSCHRAAVTLARVLGHDQCATTGGVGEAPCVQPPYSHGIGRRRTLANRCTPLTRGNRRGRTTADPSHSTTDQEVAGSNPAERTASAQVEGVVPVVAAPSSCLVQPQMQPRQ